MAVCEQDIWGKLLTVSPRGFLRWRPDINKRVFCDPAKGTDSRAYPERYMVMCGPLHPLEKHNPVFDTSDLVQVSPNEFETHEGEITGVNGLLRLVDKFPVEFRTPDRILLVGSISPSSLLSVLAWCREKDWKKTQITLVDNSPVPIETLRLMQKEGYFDWPGGVSLVEEDILSYEPTEKPDFVVADILNAWLIDKYQYPNLQKRSPYSPFENFLRWGARAVGDTGWFFSRCMIFPSLPQRKDPNLRFAQEAQARAEQVVAQLGDLAGSVNRTAIEEGVEQLFDEALRTTFCGLDRVYPVYRSERTLAGTHAERVMRRIHNRSFQTTHEIRVSDEKSGFKFLSFACQGVRI